MLLGGYLTLKIYLEPIVFYQVVNCHIFKYGNFLDFGISPQFLFSNDKNVIDWKLLLCKILVQVFYYLSY